MKYFGTDGIRGIYGQNLTDRLAYRAALAASKFLEGECYVATDTRVSSDSLAAAVVTGLTQGGCNVRMLGVMPTPAVSFLAAKHGAGGIMISASHNPPEYNGLKFFTHMGYKFSAQLESAVEELIDSPPARIGGGKVFRCDEGREEYLSCLVKRAGRLEGEFVLDCAFGAASAVAEEAFARCGASVKVYNNERDGSKINAGVGALYPQFVESVAGTKTGFAFDGDGDRLVAVQGSPVDGDSVLYNLALALKPSGVAGTVLNNTALEVALREMGIPFIRTAVGDKNISLAMRRHKFPLGGEQSGHYIISPSASGDALIAALLLAKVGTYQRLNLIPQVEASVEADKSILNKRTFIEAKKCCEQMLGPGRLVVRMSGTEPKIRLMAESEDSELASKSIEILIKAINDCLKEEL